MGANFSGGPLAVEPSYDVSLYDADAKYPDAASPCKTEQNSLDLNHPAPSGLVIVHDGAWETYREDFTIQLKGFGGFEFWQGVRSRDDFERLREVFEMECGTFGAGPMGLLGPLPKRPEFIQMNHWKWACYLRETRSGLQRWLDTAIRTKLCDSMLWRHLLLNQANFQVQPADAAWLDLAHAVLGLPTMMNIMSFLEEPADVARLCYLSAGWICHSTAPYCPKQWETMYADRWPAFHEAQKYVSDLSRSEVDWKLMYWHTLAGQFETVLEAYDREKKLGFAMSCMLAKVTWDSHINCYIAKYVSASQVLPEKIPYHEGYRLRFCPPSARTLKPELVPPQASELYGYRVLEGVPDLKIGQGLELQWKMQQGSPFGWWFGTVESLERDAGGSRAKVTMIFDHFPATSRWRRLQIIIGDGVVRQCAIGGWHGGVRAVTEAEKKDWVKFYPKEPVIF